MRALLLALIALSPLSIPGFAQENGRPESKTGRYLVIEGSESPDRRLAVAWGLPNQPKLWSQVMAAAEENAEEVLSEVAVVDGSVENYLVDTAGGSILCKLDSRFWNVRDLRPNRRHLEVAWLPAGDVALINYTVGADCVSLQTVQIVNGKAAGLIDVKAIAVPLARRQLLKLGKPPRNIRREDIAVSFSDLETVGERGFEFTVDGVTSREDENGWSASETVRFFAMPDPKGLKLLNLTVRPKE